MDLLDPGQDPARSPVLSELKLFIDAKIMASTQVLTPWVRSLVTGEYVYILNGDGREELYDRSGDPRELRNIATEPGSQPALEPIRKVFNQASRE